MYNKNALASQGGESPSNISVESPVVKTVPYESDRLADLFNHKLLTQEDEKTIAGQMRVDLHNYAQAVLRTGYGALVCTRYARQAIFSKSPRSRLEKKFRNSKVVYESYPNTFQEVDELIHANRSLMQRLGGNDKAVLKTIRANASEIQKLLLPWEPRISILDECLAGTEHELGIMEYAQREKNASKQGRNEEYLSIARGAIAIPQDLTGILTNALQGRKSYLQGMDIFVKANVRLVQTILSSMPLPKEFSYSEDSDFMSEGLLGLMRAAEKYNPEAGKFSTYAAWWIRQKIFRAFQDTHTVFSIPVHAQGKLVRLNRVRDQIHQEDGNEEYIPSAELENRSGLSAGQIRDLKNASGRVISLDDFIAGEEGDSTYHQSIGDASQETADTQLSHNEQHEKIRSLISKLSDRESQILTARFGLNGDEEQTLEEVGLKYGVTRERIRQIQNLALGKLRKLWKG